MLWEFSTKQMILSFVFLGCLSFIGGWLADRILGYSGFSVIGNSFILLLGGYVGLICYNLLGYRFYWDSYFTMMICIGSALAMMFTMLAIKTTLHLR